MVRHAWSDGEYIVIVAIFSVSEFKQGDDNQSLCHDIASAFNRTPATIDRQWRNIGDILNGKPAKKIGKKLIYWTRQMLEDKQMIIRTALEYCKQNNWHLFKYLG